MVSLFKIRHHLSPELLEISIQSHVFPQLQYCLSVWGGAHACRLDRLHKVINFAVRLVTGLRRYDRIGPALAALDWPRIEKLIARRDAVNVHRAIYEPDAPVSLSEMFLPRSAVSERVTRATVSGASVLHLPNLHTRTSHKKGQYCMLATNALAHMYNQLLKQPYIYNHPLTAKKHGEHTKHLPPPKKRSVYQSPIVNPHTPLSRYKSKRLKGKQHSNTCHEHE